MQFILQSLLLLLIPFVSAGMNRTLYMNDTSGVVKVYGNSWKSGPLPNGVETCAPWSMGYADGAVFKFKGTAAYLVGDTPATGAVVATIDGNPVFVGHTPNGILGCDQPVFIWEGLEDKEHVLNITQIAQPGSHNLILFSTFTYSSSA